MNFRMKIILTVLNGRIQFYLPIFFKYRVFSMPWVQVRKSD